MWLYIYTVKFKGENQYNIVYVIARAPPIGAIWEKKSP